MKNARKIRIAMGMSASVSPVAEGLLLVGGGRNARNLICILETAGITVGRVVDDRPAGSVLGHEVGFIDDVDGATVDALLTVADPDHAQAIRERPALRGCRWPRIIHPSSVVSSHAQMGEGCYVGPFALVTDVDLGRHVHLFAHNVLGARVAVGDFSVVLPHATVASDVRIGKRCMIGMGARIHAGVSIGDDCRIGVNAVIRNDMPDGSIAICNRPTSIRNRLTFARTARSGG
ncbi:DapH/DapD/GlmU-related protein [Azospirillum sp. CT11-132]|uniref:DapH/DapD/GlmU-related protein n=1 Tax=unclassified Azospirillum TaxID=2630922 RepID=UPI000D644875|nr:MULTISPECIES: DapH/DapD/GlmU-related protein [unclassified Azospirillum]